MKKRVLIITLIGLSLAIKAQNKIETTGNVGIGTTNPNAKLQIGNIGGNDKSIKIPGTYNFENANLSMGVNGNAQLEFVTHTGVSTSGATRLYGADVAHLYFQTATSNSSYNNLNYKTKMTLTNAGNLGIGTKITGNHKLAVEGSIGAREIKVEINGWSDFVFENDYNLPTLKEVENHIKEKGHLKDIPSAEEVAKNGVFLGEMNSKLLQKIEELTLYTIQQEKKIKKVEKENESLKFINLKLLELQKRLEKLEKK